MSYLIWNARGLGSKRAFHQLRQLLVGTTPDVVFICETRLVQRKCKFWKTIFGFEGMLVIDCTGQQGGLLMMWKEMACVSILNYSAGHIDCIIDMEKKKWRFTGFYGSPHINSRQDSWTLLRRLKNNDYGRGIPWLVGGDFNEILTDREKVGGRPRLTRQMLNFYEALQDCNLEKMNKDDVTLTWFNKRKGENAIFERLDRFVCNKQWQEMYPNAQVKSLDFFGSDHRPILCVLENEAKEIQQVGSRRFHFEDKWLLDTNFAPDFMKEWENIAMIDSLPNKLKACQGYLQRWSGSNFDGMGRRIKELRKERQKLMEKVDIEASTDKVLIVSAQIEELVEIEATHWQQRSKLNWLKDGDRNTAIFHACATNRKKKNEVKELIDEGGQTVTKEKEKASVIANYFQKLFTSTKPMQQVVEEVVQSNTSRLGEIGQQALTARYTEEEIRRAIKDMHPSKSPGPDGFSASNYQKFWPVVGDRLQGKCWKY